MKNYVLIFAGMLLGYGINFIFASKSSTTSQVSLINEKNTSASSKSSLLKKNPIVAPDATAAKNATSAQVIKSQDAINKEVSDNLSIEQNCLQQIQPSHIRELYNLWRRKSESYVDTNDFLWSPRGPHPFDANTFKRALGSYKGVAKFNHNPDLDVRLQLNLKSETEGKLIYQLIERKGSKAITSDSSTDLKPANSIGTEERANVIHLVWNNGNPQQFGEEYKYFGIKIPVDMQSKQQIQLEIYGLHETLSWKYVGNIDLEKN